MKTSNEYVCVHVMTDIRSGKVKKSFILKQSIETLATIPGDTLHLDSRNLKVLAYFKPAIEKVDDYQCYSVIITELAGENYNGTIRYIADATLVTSIQYTQPLYIPRYRPNHFTVQANTTC